MKNAKKLFFFGLIAMGISMCPGVQGKAAVSVDEKNFPDASVRAFAKSVDADRDGVLSDQELGTVDYFTWYPGTDGGKYGPAVGSVVDFTGMEHFTKIKSVILRGVGNGEQSWNYADSDLFQFFPYVKNLEISLSEKGTVSVSGSAAHLEYLFFSGWKAGSENAVIEKLDLKADKLKTLEIEDMNIRKCERSFEGMKALKEMKIRTWFFPENGISLKGLSSLEDLSLLGTFRTLDLTPAKKSLKKLYLSDTSDHPDIPEGQGNHALKTLDISQMEKLEVIHAGDCGFTSFTTRDAQGRTKAKKLKDISLSGCSIKSFDATCMPELEKLYLLSTKISQLDVTKNKKLKELGVSSPNMKKITLTKNKKLDTLVLYGDKLNAMKELDLSRNRLLRSLKVGGFSKVVRVKRLILPMPGKSLKWKRSGMFDSYYEYDANVLDLSAITKLTSGTKKHQLTIPEKSKIKKVMISRKLKKADKKWIKKWAKKAKAKVAVK